MRRATLALLAASAAAQGWGASLRFREDGTFKIGVSEAVGHSV